MYTYGFKLLSGRFDFEHVKPTSEKGVHEFYLLPNGEIRYHGPFVTPPAGPSGPGIHVVIPPDLTGIRVYGVTPVPSEEVPDDGIVGGGTAPWTRRTPNYSVQQALEIRRGVQDVMDLFGLLVLTGILDE